MIYFPRICKIYIFKTQLYFFLAWICFGTSIFLKRKMRVDVFCHSRIMYENETMNTALIIRDPFVILTTIVRGNIAARLSEISRGWN